jgi:Spy/CpxP family protein refolding chaperone
MRFSRGAITLYVGLVFACGLVLGAFGDRLYNASAVVAKPAATKNPEEFRKKIIAEYQSRLKLTDDQVAKLNAIMDETRSRVEETRQKLKPAYQKIHEEQSEKVRALLSPDQQIEYDKMRKEREQRDQQKASHGPGPGF